MIRVIKLTEYKTKNRYFKYFLFSSEKAFRKTYFVIHISMVLYIYMNDKTKNFHGLFSRIYVCNTIKKITMYCKFSSQLPNVNFLCFC